MVHLHASGDGFLSISSCQSDAAGSTINDEIIGIYTAASCAGPFTEVACDDDACTTLGLQSIVTTNLNCGTLYYILVSGFGVIPSTGDIQLKVTAPACTVTAYTMTGGGTSCATPGVSVGLSGSDLCFNYQLFRGLTPLATLPGHGCCAGLRSANNSRHLHGDLHQRIAAKLHRYHVRFVRGGDRRSRYRR